MFLPFRISDRATISPDNYLTFSRYSSLRAHSKFSTCILMLLTPSTVDLCLKGAPYCRGPFLFFSFDHGFSCFYVLLITFQINGHPVRCCMVCMLFIGRYSSFGSFAIYTKTLFGLHFTMSIEQIHRFIEDSVYNNTCSKYSAINNTAVIITIPYTPLAAAGVQLFVQSF